MQVRRKTLCNIVAHKINYEVSVLGKGACEVQEKGENQTEGYTISILMMTMTMMMMMMITMIMMMTTNFEIMVKMMIMLTTALMMITIACKQALAGSAAQEGKPWEEPVSKGSSLAMPQWVWEPARRLWWHWQWWLQPIATPQLVLLATDKDERYFCSQWHRHTWKKKIWVLPIGVEPMTFWLLAWMLYRWAIRDSWHIEATALGH